MILLAFFLPLAVYLLILGTINRRHHPLLVSGPWDFVGVLFAVSGFLLFGGPGVLSVLNDRWRTSLLFGREPNSSAATERLWYWWLVLTALYFVLIAGGASLLLWRRRNQLAIYNVDPNAVREALDRVFFRLGLRPTRSADTYYFGFNPTPTAGPNDAAHTLFRPADDADGGAIQTRPGAAPRPAALAAPRPPEPKVILEFDAFRPLAHVTLRWQPARSALRREVEEELGQELSETLSPPHALGMWLSLVGCVLFFIALVAGCGALLYQWRMP